MAPRSKIKRRWWHYVLIAVLVGCFLALAWWQWTRFQSGSGSFQNLGYALQWPLFAAFVVYAYRTAINYENERIEAENSASESGAADFQYSATRSEHIAADFLPPRPTVDIEEFNRDNRRRRGEFDSQQRA